MKGGSSGKRRKREHEQDWEKTREKRIDTWREFSKKPTGTGKKVKKMKTLG